MDSLPRHTFRQLGGPRWRRDTFMNNYVTGGIERRSVSSLRAPTDDKFELRGIAAAYNVPSKDLGGFVETVAPTAFKRALRDKQDVFALINHSPDQVLGRVGNNTLTLSDSPQGLRFVVKLNPESQAHRNLYASVKRGDISECSFAFKVANGGEKWETRGAVRKRTLTDVDLFDVSAVTYPAYGGGATSVEARSLAYGLDPTWEQLRRKVREVGMTILAERQALVEDMTYRAEANRIGRELGRERSLAARVRFEKALLGLDD
jgi:uncharacterized protein